MSAIGNQPDNTNYLSPFGFQLVLQRAPTVKYFAQGVTLPTVSLPEIEQPTPFIRIPYPTDKLLYEPLVIRFRVDEDMKNWLEIYNWMFSLAPPVDKEPYKDAVGGERGEVYKALSDGTLAILNSAKGITKSFFFHDMFPTSLSPLQFDVTGADIEYLESDVTLRYRFFTVE